MAGFAVWLHRAGVRIQKRDSADSTLPIGRAARVAFELEAMRAACSRSAKVIIQTRPLDEGELEDCAVLDDALAAAHRILKAAVRDVMLDRLNRRSRSGRAR